MKKRALIFAVAGVVSGCMNMPTPPSQVTGAHVPSALYEHDSCAQLSTEAAALARRENELVAAQEQRIKTSQVQAFWWGFGQGDGIEAPELADVRGEQAAVQKALQEKDCRS